MIRLRLWVVGCMILGGVSLALALPAHLALTDIARGEGDPGAEWRMLRVAAIATAAFHAVALLTFARLLRVLRRADSDGR